jgi:hypothetical protein
MDALRDHGYCLPGKDTRRPVRGLDIAKGVTVTDLLTTWGGTKPINPSSHEDREAYKAEHSRRRKVLIRVLNSLVAEGKLTCPGVLSNSDFSLPVRQVGP